MTLVNLSLPIGYTAWLDAIEYSLPNSILPPIAGPSNRNRIMTNRRRKALGRPILMQEIADIAGVSKSTVSRALASSPLISKGTRESIREIARQQGYRLNKKARNFQSSSTLTVAVVVAEPNRREWSFTDPFFLQLLGRIANELDNLGHELLLANIRVEIDEWIERHMVRGHCDGAILMCQGHCHDKMNAIAKTSIPIVAWGGKLKQQNYCTVGSDNRLGGYLATQHLLDQGRSKISFVGHRGMPELALRYSGYRGAHIENGAAANPELVVDTGVSGAIAEAAFDGFLMDTPAVDAVVATSDVVALGVMRSILKTGRRIPDDIAVVGYDDIAVAQSVSPSLSTIRQDDALGARLLVRKLVSAIDGARVRSRIIEPELVVRESSDPKATHSSH